VIANGCLIRKEGARREHLDYTYRGLMSQHPHFTATLCQSPQTDTSLLAVTGLSIIELDVEF
jgi:hypothetical protein